MITCSNSRTAILVLAAITSIPTQAAEPSPSAPATNTSTVWRMHDMTRPVPRAVLPGAQFSQLAPPPADAIVLFDGKDLSKFRSGSGEAKWKVENGYFEVVRGTGSIQTKDTFADFQMHLEFATPAEVTGTSQNRGNSGIKVQGLYEIQILDSIDNPTYPDGSVGAIYGQTPPLANASKLPGEWQTYDLIFEAPRWDATGKLIKKANLTLIHNGVVLHHRREIQGRTTDSFRATYGDPHPPEMFIELQDHNTPVRYRNIWVRKLGEYDQP